MTKDVNHSNLNVGNDIFSELKLFIKSIVRESMKDVIDEMKFNVMDQDRTLTSDELCERWSISKNTLYSWEKDGIISKLPIGGKRKIYSMSSVLEVENSGHLKRAC